MKLPFQKRQVNLKAYSAILGIWVALKVFSLTISRAWDWHVSKEKYSTACLCDHDDQKSNLAHPQPRQWRDPDFLPFYREADSGQVCFIQGFCRCLFMWTRNSNLWEEKSREMKGRSNCGYHERELLWFECVLYKLCVR
jgi:hypothetical protein